MKSILRGYVFLISLVNMFFWVIAAVLVIVSSAMTPAERTSTTLEQTRNCAVKTVSMSKYIRDTLTRHGSIEGAILQQLTSLSSIGHIWQTEPTRRQVDGGSSIPAALLKSVYVLQRMVKITDDSDAIIQAISPMDDEIKEVQYISRVFKNSNRSFYGKILDFALDKQPDSSRLGDQYVVFLRCIEDQQAKSLFNFVMAYEDHRYRETAHAEKFRVLIQMMKPLYELLPEAMMASRNEKRLDNLALIIHKIFLLRPAIQIAANALTESEGFDENLQALYHHEEIWKRLYTQSNLFFKQLEEDSAQSTTTTEAVLTVTYTMPDLSDILLDNQRASNPTKGKRKNKNRNTRKDKPQARPVVAVEDDVTALVTEEREPQMSPSISDIISAADIEDENPHEWTLVPKSSEKSKKTTRSIMNPHAISTTVTTRKATTSRTTTQMPMSTAPVKPHSAPKEEPTSLTTDAQRDEAISTPGTMAVTSDFEMNVHDISQIGTVGTTTSQVSTISGSLTAVLNTQRVMAGGDSTTINNSELDRANVIPMGHEYSADSSPCFEPIYQGPVHGLVSGYLGIPLVKPPVDMMWYLSSQIIDLSNQMEFFYQQASMQAVNDPAIAANVAQFRRKLNKARRAIEEMNLSANGLAEFVNRIPTVVLQQSSVN